MPEFCPVITPLVSDEVLRGYLECAEWTLDDETRDQAEGFSPSAELAAEKDCCEFQTLAGDLLANMNGSQIGHDLWLTRNHHGAGFWDRGLGEIGDKLTTLAHGMGSCETYVGADGLVYFFGRENEKTDAA
jgi:hypothetical protein